MGRLSGQLGRTPKELQGLVTEMVRVESLAHRKVLLDEMLVCLEGWVAEWLDGNV